MAFVTTYFDESYTSPNPDVYTVAGYVSTNRRWTKFQRKWQALLTQEVEKEWRSVYGPDKKPFFHMSDFDNPHSKIYGDWSERKKIWFLQELHQIIQGAYLRSFSTGVIQSDYDALSDAEKFAIGTPHVCAAGNCVKLVAEWARRENRREPILYVFERGTIHDKALNRIYNDTLSDFTAHQE